MQDFERLGVFYLGHRYDLDAKKPTDELVLYDSKDLMTHAVCVGMTGSGKTGLCLALLEEAAIDNIPAIIVDPKGDLGNLMLAFPQLRAEDFEPWIDPADAQRSSVTPQQLAAQTAEQWKNGLAASGQDGARIQRYRAAVDIAIYTPASNAGLPLTVLRSFQAPPVTTRENAETFREVVTAAASGLLGLLGIDADPLKSREHILISKVFEQAWMAGQDVDIPSLVRSIQTPSFDTVGVIDLESFYPAKERFELAMQLNNLLASPGFSAWMQGEPLNVQQLLYTAEGKPRLSILSIAHLSDAERMFFVTILLSEVLSWMRAQPGTSSLRALLYMDEVFGFFPPSSNPPSKRPMLTLLKQARAFGLGVVLATQNPVDLDYKGLANCGTWLLGRLQTERDKLRVLDGLEGAASGAGTGFDRAQMDRMLSGLGKRVFLLNNVHDDHPVVFQSRWALSFLRGPLTREHISRLMAERKEKTPLTAVPQSPKPTASSGGVAVQPDRPVLPPEITERFLARRANLPEGASLHYRPALLGQAKVHFAQASSGTDEWQDVALLLTLDGSVPADTWGAAEELDEVPDLEQKPEANAKFATLSSELSRPKRFAQLATELKDFLYRNRKLQQWKCKSLKQNSLPNEKEVDFRTRLAQIAREERDRQVEALRQKYAPKVADLQERIRKAQVKVAKEQSQATEKTLSAALSMGASVLGAMFSRKLASSANITRASSTMKQAGRIARERQDITDAAEGVEALNEKLAVLEAEFRTATEKVQTDLAPDAVPLESLLVKPKKSEINVSPITLVWTPWIAEPDGTETTGY